MRRLLHKIIQLLDGTPAVYGKRQSGQSVVELALITPILIILFAGLVEIGWFANNYLTLLDVTRAGARRAATLSDTLSPLSWDNKRSFFPIVPSGDPGYPALLALPTRYQMPQNGTNGMDFQRQRGCFSNQAQRGFYDEVICVMLTTLQPLQLDGLNGVDDVIVSAFSVDMVDPTRRHAMTMTGDPWLGPNRPVRDPATGTPLDVPQMVVVGRYPTNANECDVRANPDGTPNYLAGSLEPRDPFDFNQNQLIDRIDITGLPTTSYTLNVYNELEGFDVRAGSAQEAEKQVGYTYTGNHRIPFTNCIGSEWTMARVEQLMNLPNYPLVDNFQRGALPGQGLVVVEMFWQHTLLLQMPLFSPVFDIMGGTPTISVWAAFPLPAVEPYIIYPCPPSSVSPRPVGC